MPNLYAIQESALNPDFIKARMAFGMAGGAYQDGHTDNFFKITPLYLNAITGAVATGNMHELFLRQDTAPQTLEEAYQEKNIERLPDDVRETMWNLMHNVTAETASLNETEAYQIYIKTGTADDDTTLINGVPLRNLLITGFVTKNDVHDAEIEGKVITLFAKNGYEIQQVIPKENSFGSTLAEYYQKIIEIVMD